MNRSDKITYIMRQYEGKKFHSPDLDNIKNGLQSMSDTELEEKYNLMKMAQEQDPIVGILALLAMGK